MIYWLRTITAQHWSNTHPDWTTEQHLDQLFNLYYDISNGKEWTDPKEIIFIGKHGYNHDSSSILKSVKTSYMIYDFMANNRIYQLTVPIVNKKYLSGDLVRVFSKKDIDNYPVMPSRKSLGIIESSNPLQFIKEFERAIWSDSGDDDGDNGKQEYVDSPVPSGELVPVLVRR